MDLESTVELRVVELGVELEIELIELAAAVEIEAGIELEIEPIRVDTKLDIGEN